MRDIHLYKFQPFEGENILESYKLLENLTWAERTTKRWKTSNYTQQHKTENSDGNIIT